ncbi:hypothetical protein CK203_117296 [Vitis vinifera]|uniref:Uncharacterized protein n=1 Tax=Vitis vinifera TaxID=29760 RepID=A0A438FCQ7_VITVI|nr:hypothetical protein CK203_117296 [Vitis vinifera]
MLVANIGKLQEKFHSKRAAKFRSKRTTFSQPKADFAAVQNLPSAWSDWLPMAVTPSFQLRIAFVYGKDFKTSVLHVSKLSIALPWIPKNSPQSRIALVFKAVKRYLIEPPILRAPSPANNSTCMARYLAMVKEGLKKLDEWIIKCIPQ